ncbi:hypothetical protein [Halolamina salifodinae]|uniref:Nucleotide-binding universal stress UspA family protein n=1 Tax=Halolamina salifodinae TaxID=1202767 RepID=A0A8T4GYB2_9EURY|nr:hypothetical protein [Halolamina salifodinae]MBP1986345.1 nucleotide-binding universal stress UspA family protein [Halolamina salifodinae]
MYDGVLAEYATERGADTLVAGAHKKRALDRFPTGTPSSAWSGPPTAPC